MRIAAILAGGQSRRMGKDKAVMELNGERMMDRVIARLRPQVDVLCLIGPCSYETGLPSVLDDQEFEGPLAGVFGMYAWVLAHHPDAQGFLTAPVDAPLCPVDLFDNLSQMDGSAMAADPARVHPTFAYWHVAELAQARSKLSPAGSLHSLAETIGAWPVVWPSGEAFINLNTPDDVGRFLAAGRD